MQAIMVFMKYDFTSKIKMANISTIRQGHLFRKGIRNLPRGEVNLIQPSDVDEDSDIEFHKLHKVRLSDIKKAAMIGADDVIVKSKSSRPIFFKVNIPKGSYAVTDQFLIISIDKNIINPDYLLWYFKTKNVKRYLRNRMCGTSVPFIKKETIEKMEVPVPSLKNQERIIMLDRLMKEEKRLSEEIIDHKKKIIEKASMTIIQGSD